MKCKRCDTEIADKALICYRCGTATTEAKYQPVALRPKRSGPGRLVIALLAALLLLAAIYYLRVFVGHSREDARPPVPPQSELRSPRPVPRVASVRARVDGEQAAASPEARAPGVVR